MFLVYLNRVLEFAVNNHEQNWVNIWKHLQWSKPFLFPFNVTLQDVYDEAFRNEVYGTPEVKLSDLQKSRVPGHGAVRITYSTKDNFKSFAKALRIMNDFKVSIIQGILKETEYFYNTNMGQADLQNLFPTINLLHH